ncbi:unnamed protein product [Ilex paraguariensis]|uniref:SRP9 domain-containing protein n=1 Tax=Ilex paraguariensis TaxID=185542 RepID=A0ABC8RFQ1_9AQUA
MVYITSWDNFVEKSVKLFRANPERTRYGMKYRHCDGKLVLKVTDAKEAREEVPWAPTIREGDAREKVGVGRVAEALSAHVGDMREEAQAGRATV